MPSAILRDLPCNPRDDRVPRRLRRARAHLLRRSPPGDRQAAAAVRGAEDPLPGRPGPVGRPPNYLGHPSPFYVLMALVLDRTLPPRQAILKIGRAHV